MAKVVIAGDAIVITSSMKLEDIKMVKKYRPEALILKDEEKLKFAVGTTDGPGSVNDIGISFGRETHDDKKLAMITLNLDHTAKDVTEYVVETYGGTVSNLNEIEAKLGSVLDEIAAQKAAVRNSITIAGAEQTSAAADPQ